MAYKKTYQNSGFPFKNNMASQRGPYPQQMPQQFKKHSGAKLTRYNNAQGVERHLTTGWRLHGKDLISFKCVTTDKSVLGDKGWFGSVACTLTNKATGEQHLHWGTMHKSTGKVVINELSIVLNPRAKNGGYCGTYINS